MKRFSPFALLFLVAALPRAVIRAGRQGPLGARGRRRARAETRTEVPRLRPAGAYVPKGNVIEIELSQYAGYAGLVVANGGLEPNDSSIFAKKHGFKLQDHALGGGELVGAQQRQARRVGDDRGRARGVRTPVPGRRAGPDRVLTRRRRRRRPEGDQAHQRPQRQGARDGPVHRGGFLHPLPGAGGRASRSTCSPDLKTKADPDKLNLVYCADGFGAGDIFLARREGGAQPAGGMRDVGAEDDRGRRRQRLEGRAAHDEPQSPDHRGHPRRQQRIRGRESRDGRRASSAASSKATGWFATTRTRTST